MTERETRMAFQAEQAAKQKADFERRQQEHQNYLESEEYQRDQHDAYEKLWAAKAQKEGWQYTPKPFKGALQRKQESEQQREAEIAYLKERLAQLENK